MQYKIGQTIKLFHNDKNIIVKVEEDKKSTCNNCFFVNEKGICLRNLYKNMNYAFCGSTFRKDNKNIIYKQIN